MGKIAGIKGKSPEAYCRIIRQAEHLYAIEFRRTGYLVR